MVQDNKRSGNGERTVRCGRVWATVPSRGVSPRRRMARRGTKQVPSRAESNKGQRGGDEGGAAMSSTPSTSEREGWSRS